MRGGQCLDGGGYIGRTRIRLKMKRLRTDGMELLGKGREGGLYLVLFCFVLYLFFWGFCTPHLFRRPGPYLLSDMLNM